MSINVWVFFFKMENTSQAQTKDDGRISLIRGKSRPESTTGLRPPSVGSSWVALIPPGWHGAAGP